MPITAPTDISNCQLWLHRGEWYTDAGVTKVASAGDQTQQWSDRSGNGHHATQTTASKKPTYVPSAWKGLDGLRFTRSSSQELAIDCSWMFDVEVTLFVISRRRSGLAGNTDYYFGSSVAGTNGGSLHTGYRNDTTLTEAFWSNDVNETVAGFSATREDWRRHTFLWGGLVAGGGITRALWTGDVLLFSSTTDTSRLNSSANAASSRVGSAVGVFFDGELYEIIGYDKNLDGTERQDVWDWLTSEGYALDQRAIVTAHGASALARDVATPVPKARLTAQGVSVLAVDLSFPPSGARLSALGASVLAIDAATPAAGGALVPARSFLIL